MVCTPQIPTLRRQRQEGLCECETTPVYRVSSRTARTTQRNTVLKNQKEKKKKPGVGKEVASLAPAVGYTSFNIGCDQDFKNFSLALEDTL